jgi:5-hydroxyisourate hydrolase
MCAEVHQQQGDGTWRRITSAVTDVNGRIDNWDTPFLMQTGLYRFIFKTGSHYASDNTPTFFPEVQVQFEVTDRGNHYHVPLLLSPYGYSTYRGQ